MAVDFRIVIPARYASQRLPGKPLREINGKSMIEWVYLAARQSEAGEVVVATDDQRIADAVNGFGGSACLTSSAHRSGTDRILEVTQKLGWSDDTIVVNLQGDEPLMPSVNITQVARLLARADCDMATLHKSIDAAAAADPNQVKLVLDKDGRARYFSRSVIPFDRSGETDRYLGHIGIYAYRVAFIETFSALPPCELELAESLEQLRSLCNGYSICSELAQASPGPGIDTEQDLARVTEMMAKKAR